ncbi:titin [Drosophila eugracilis]|uniref:titin n=1 Tax=Drosophila eugracilis TaxID=29029 RepID=UPI0007E87FB0|nr:titin [Drosophila eugracilis]XP_017069156.1 titin [Drosophila eugracilis]XP_017069157.1 titin [Drosophila eugracilis]
MKTTIVEERSVNETIETIATSSGTIQETIEIVNIDGSPAPKQRHHHHHHHRHHHHHERQENVEVVEEVILVENEPKARKHHNHHKQRTSPPPPLPQTSPPFLTPTEEVGFNVVWEPQAFWNQPSPNPSTDLDLSPEKDVEEILDTTSASDEFTTVVWETETKESIRESQKHTRVVEEQIITEQLDPPPYAPPQLQVQTGFFPVAQQPPLSPIAEVVQTDIFVESVESSKPPTGYIPRISLNPTETVVENVEVVVPAQIQQEPEFIPKPGFVARLVENIEVAAASVSTQATPAPKGYYARSGLVDTVVEDIEVIREDPPVQDVVVDSVVEDIEPDSPFLLPPNGFDAEETITENIEVVDDSPFLLPANGFDSEPVCVETIVENIEVLPPKPILPIPVQNTVPEGYVESVVENIEVVKEDDPPFLLPVQNGFLSQTGNVETIVENIEITTAVDPPLRPPVQNVNPPRSGFVESIVESIEVTAEVDPPQPAIPNGLPSQTGFVESIVENIEVTEEVDSPVETPVQLSFPPRSGFVESIVENIEVTGEVEPPLRPPLPISYPPRSGFVESIVENIEVTEVSPPYQPPPQVDILPQTGFVESVVEDIEITEPEITVEEIEVLRNPPQQSIVTTNYMPRASLVQELVVESLEVTPASSPPPEQFPFISRESLIEVDDYVEVEEATPYNTAQNSPFVEVERLSDAEAYVEIIEVTPVNTPPSSPSLQRPIESGFLPRPSLAETAVIVASLEVTPTPTPPPSPQLKLIIPPSNPPQTEVIVESVDVTPVPSPPPPAKPSAKPLNSFILTDLVIEDPPFVEVVEREVIVESANNGEVTEVIEVTEEIIQPATPIGTVLVGEVSEQSTDKFGKRYSVSAALAEGLQQEQGTQEAKPAPPPIQKRDISANEPPKRKCCHCKCIIS